MPEFNLLDENFVIAHTNKYVIYEFWRCAIDDPGRVCDLAASLYPLKEEQIFRIFQENWVKYKDPFLRSAVFFVLNRYSTHGSISTGDFKEDNFNPLALHHLRNIDLPRFHLKLDQEEDFLQSAAAIEEADCLLFPVGAYSSNLFEEGKAAGFEETKIYHKRLGNFFKNSKKKCVLMYFKHNNLFKTYRNHNIIMINEWGKITDKKENCKEMLIANF
jgi:site-specific DNA-adenine methylase